jgi:hypothetical protein
LECGCQVVRMVVEWRWLCVGVVVGCGCRGVPMVVDLIVGMLMVLVSLLVLVLMMVEL